VPRHAALRMLTMDFQSEDKLPIQGNVQPPTPIPNPMNEMAQSGPMMMQPHNPMMGACSPYPGMAPQQVMPQQVMAQQVMAQQVMTQQMTAPVMMPSGVYPMGGQLNGYA